MDTTASGVRIDVSRGPNWLFLRLEPMNTPAKESLVDQVWAVVSKHFVYRVVLEFDPKFDALSREQVVQLDRVRELLEEHDGALRVCGLSKKCADRLAAHCIESKIKSRLTSHASVAAALFGPASAKTELPGTHHAPGDSEPITQDIAYEALRVH